MAIMGWSSAEMAARYQHVLNTIRKGVADQMGGLLWDSSDDSLLSSGGAESTPTAKQSGTNSSLEQQFLKVDVL